MSELPSFPAEQPSIPPPGSIERLETDIHDLADFLRARLTKKEDVARANWLENGILQTTSEPQSVQEAWLELAEKLSPDDQEIARQKVEDAYWGNL